MTAYQTDIPDPARSEVAMSLWLSISGLVVFGQKNSAAPSEPLPESQFLRHHTQERQLKASAGVAMPAKL